MSTLTKQEKDALEDVFLSIHTGNNKYKKLKELSSFIIADEISSVLSKLLKRAKFGLKKRKSSHFLSFLDKKEEIFKQINYKVSVAELHNNKIIF